MMAGHLTTESSSLVLLLRSLCLLVFLLSLRAVGSWGCVEREREALLRFKDGLVDGYGILSSWDSISDCCQKWRGVSCSNLTGHVIMLSLPAPPIENSYVHKSLRGEISPYNSLSELEELTHLDLSCNDFQGSPIWPPPLFLSSPPNLQYLNLSHANFSGPLPSQLGNLSNLVSLDLSFNRDLHSENLDWLSHLPSLRHLDFGSVNLSKAIHWSESINKLPSLIHLNLRYCSLPPLSLSPHVNSSYAPLAFLDLSSNDLDLIASSLIIPWLFNFSFTLVHLDLSWNNGLNGSIPEAFGNMMSSLTYLDLSINQLQGPIPEAFGNMMTSLIHLDLSNNQLNGSIPEAFGNMMTSLTYLDLSYNQLQGPIPEAFGNMMSSLTYLCLSFNQLQGPIPEAFGNMMSSLTYLDLSNNQLQGPIPEAFGNLASVEQLYLNENKLEGEIPKSLSNNLCHLQELHLQNNSLSGQLPQDLLACANQTLDSLFLSQNHFTGSIPALIGFSSLRELYLDDNQLNGTLPESIGCLTKLEILYMRSNSLQGAITEAHLLHLSQLVGLDLSFTPDLTFNISSEWVPPFQLRYLRLTSCKLGHRFPTWLQTQRQLGSLDISNSEILDVIPYWFWNLTFNIYRFNISNNQLRGTLPNNLSSTSHRPIFIDVSSNYLGGSIPQLPSNLYWLDLSNNKFSGSISSFCSVSLSYLAHLDLSNNYLSGELPNCLPLWKSLVVLNLENNQFFGEIPNSFGSLQWIHSLHLRNNSLTGELPPSLKKCQNLRFIDLAKNKLSGKIPSWIGESLTNLTVLNLRSNNFSGSICSELCQLQRIQILDLSDNNMLGRIPRCLSNLTAITKKGNLPISDNYGPIFISHVLYGYWSYVDMELVKWKGREFEFKNTLGLVKSIDLSSNKLTGEIPKEVTELIELVSLNLSRNNLSGLIPVTIGQLKSLDVLDLSQNQLIGEIPTSLSEIDRLSTLDLSNNNLFGKIPRGTQLQSFNASTYGGNFALCGLPLLTKCPEDRTEEVPKASNYESSIEQDESDTWWYVSIALGFIVGFWTICGTLILNNSWRYAYFQFLNKVKD